MGKIRCTQPEEKAKKKSDILKEARNFYSKQSFFEITMGQIADQIGLAKGTIYLYFRTKEELFLELLKEDIKTFFQTFIENIYFSELNETSAMWRLRHVQGNRRTPSANASYLDNDWKLKASDNLTLSFIRSLEKCSVAELLILLKPILEEKMTPEDRRLFREWIQKEIFELSQILVQCGYFDKVTFSNRFTYQAFAGVIGLFQLSPIARDVSSSDQKSSVKAEFQMALKTFLITLYKSYQIDALNYPLQTTSLNTQQASDASPII